MKCEAAGCDNSKTRLKWCNKHYKRVYRYGDPNFTKILTRGTYTNCTFPGCQYKHHSKGLCSYHWQKTYYRSTQKGKSKLREARKKWNRTEKGRAKKAKDMQIRRNRIKRQTPKWANKDIIKNFYANCPAGYTVDHIVPLAGKNVCGLHVHYNLQYLTRSENAFKWHKFDNIEEVK